MNSFDIHSLIKLSVWSGIGDVGIKTKDNADILFLLTFIWYKVRYFLKPETHQAGGAPDGGKQVKAWAPSILFRTDSRCPTTGFFAKGEAEKNTCLT